MRDVLIAADWLTAAECQMLVRRWNSAHRETGQIAEGSSATVIDHRRKRRTDQFIRSKKLDSLLSRKLRSLLRPQTGYWTEYFRIGRYEKGGHFAPHVDNIMNRLWSAVCVLSPPELSWRRAGIPEIGSAAETRARNGDYICVTPGTRSPASSSRIPN